MVKAAKTVPMPSPLMWPRQKNVMQAVTAKGDFDPRVADVGNLRKLSREEVCRDDRHLAAVGQRDAKGDDDVAQDKIKDSQRQ